MVRFCSLRKVNLILLTVVIFLLFFVLAPVIPSNSFSGSYQVVIHYECPPGTNKTRLPSPFTMSISYAIFRFGMIYDDQLNPPIGFETGTTINLPCNP
jgi:hypothetical protein